MTLASMFAEPAWLLAAAFASLIVIAAVTIGGRRVSLLSRWLRRRRPVSPGLRADTEFDHVRVLRERAARQRELEDAEGEGLPAPDPDPRQQIVAQARRWCRRCVRDSAGPWCGVCGAVTLPTTVPTRLTWNVGPRTS